MVYTPHDRPHDRDDDTGSKPAKARDRVFELIGEIKAGMKVRTPILELSKQLGEADGDHDLELTLLRTLRKDDENTIALLLEAIEYLLDKSPRDGQD